MSRRELYEAVLPWACLPFHWVEGLKEVTAVGVRRAKSVATVVDFIVELLFGMMYDSVNSK